MKLNDKVTAAARFADLLFKDAGKMYGNKPYSTHLEAVHSVLLRFDFTDRNLLAAAFLHDILEDTEVGPLTLEALFGIEVYKLVAAVTDGEGVNRKERKAGTYANIRATPGATALKLADRIANVENSIVTEEDRMFRMYRKEQAEFEASLRVFGELDGMWNHLQALIFNRSNELTLKELPIR